ncbi:hypothetical protein OHJ16_07635 [Actinomyces israelii]|uniref:ABC transporter permease n=1 Tax=Actinomyces israelii TaxID=1659 RepID=A0ABT4I976_9ACTO|nr:hypothetical protein [Actinomyces israelii]MCZ0857914.1 hypothetical protein [Actinomyces israelii]
MTPALRRTAATLGLNLGRQARSGFWLVALIAGALVAALVRALPRPEGPGQWWPVVILGELAVTGFYFAAVHVLLEHDEGTLVARAVTPMRGGEYLAALVASLVLLALVESAVLVLIGRGTQMQWGPFLTGVACLAGLEVLYGVIAVAGYDSMSGFLLPSGVWTLVLIIPVAPLVGLQGWWLWLHPLQGAFTLVQIGFDQAPAWEAAPAVAASGAWACGGLLVARRRLTGMITRGGR